MHESLVLPTLPVAHRRQSRGAQIWQRWSWLRSGRGGPGSWQRRADLQSERRREMPDWARALRVRGAQVAAGLPPHARLNRALRCRGISGNEADVSPGCSAYCLAISRYEKWSVLLQHHAPVHNTWEPCRSPGHLHHSSYKLWDLQNKQGKKPKWQTFVSFLRLPELTAGKNP